MTYNGQVMNIVVISGSNRSGSQSLKIAQRLQEKLNNLQADTVLLDLHALALPLFDDGEHPAPDGFVEGLKSADGYVLVSPEWDGMAPAAVINFIYHSKDAMVHKPVLLCGVSSTRGGAYPVAELKAFANKNRRFVSVPEHLIFREAKTLFNASTPELGNDADAYMHERSDYALGFLLAYADALKTVRDKPGLPLDKYPNGM